MGLFKPSLVSELKERKIKWFATVTSVSEAMLAEEAGADALVVQGSEAGGHRGNFCTDYAQSVGLMALLPTVSDAVAIPIIATGGIADSRGVSAAIMLGASAVQIGTGLLRTPRQTFQPPGLMPSKTLFQRIRLYRRLIQGSQVGNKKRVHRCCGQFSQPGPSTFSYTAVFNC